jgi:hypothetical protein
MLQAGRSRVRFPMRSLDLSLYLKIPASLWSWRRQSLLQKQDDNMIAICEPIVCKIWEPRRLTTIWTSMARYRNSFAFFEMKAKSRRIGLMAMKRREKRKMQ